MLQSTFQSFLRSAQRGGRPYLLKGKEDLKTWQRRQGLMKTYIPPKGETEKKFKDSGAPERPPKAFFLFCSEYHLKIKGEHPGLSIGDVAKELGEMWNHTAAKLKENTKRILLPMELKENLMQQKKGVHRDEKSRKKKEEEEDEEDEEEEEEDDDE